MGLYDYIADKHALSHEKPDRVYSHLPTLIGIVEPKGKTIIDAGCGSGFFTRPLAPQADKVYGIDWSIEQIERARQHQPCNVQYELADMRTWLYPGSDVVCVPYILNTTNPIDILDTMKLIHHGLRPNGKFVAIVDMPRAAVHDNRQFGSRKIVHGSLERENKMSIELYREGERFLTLDAFYYPRQVFEQAAVTAGFRKFRWHQPIVSAEGMEVYGQGYWKNYLASPDVAYFSATK